MSDSRAGVSVVVCCYNSKNVLRPTLEHLAKQQTGSVDWEVIVVDNASSDETAEFAKQCWAEFGEDGYLEVIQEAKAGLSFAREAGTRRARFDIVIFCDDDNRLCENFVAKSAQILSSNPSLAACGGKGTAETDGTFPDWFEEFQGSYACGPQAENEGLVLALYGAGFAFRRDLLLSVYDDKFESLLTDRKGNELSSGGDREICQWFRLLGFGLWYSPDMKFHHFITGDRLTKSYVRRLYVAFGKTQAILKAYRVAQTSNGRGVDRSTWYHLCRSIGLLVAHLIRPPRRGARLLYLERHTHQILWFIRNPGQLARNVDHILEARDRIMAQRK